MSKTTAATSLAWRGPRGRDGCGGRGGDGGQSSVRFLNRYLFWLLVW